jgi:hypothetical protein
VYIDLKSSREIGSFFYFRVSFTLGTTSLFQRRGYIKNPP